MARILKSSLLLLAGFVLSSCAWISPPEITGITDISLSEGTLTPKFDAAVTEYKATVAHTTESVDVTVSGDDPDLVVTINDTLVLPGTGTETIPLDAGENTVTIVAGEGEDSVTYTVTVTRLPAPEVPVITSISLSEGTLTPDFDAAVTEYTATVAHTTESVDVTVSADDPDLAVTIDGTPVLPGTGTETIPLDAGDNAVTIVAGEGEDSATYTVTVTRISAPEIVVMGKANYSDEEEIELESGSTVDFGDGYFARTMSFTIRNTGSVPLALTGTPDHVIIENDDNPGNFSVSVPPTSDAIPPDEEETFSIEIIPRSGPGTKTATVTIPNDDDDEGTFTLSLTGIMYC